MRFFQKTRGSITIFLVIILVPVLVVSGLFVDVSRIRLAQAMASSAGDLTLNTVMTQYDRELNDYYGLMASAQNVDEFLNASEQYFEACMVSKGVDTTYAKDFAKQLTEMLKGETAIHDIMAVNLQDTVVTVEALNNANLTNPAMVKQQMVEFMKYRAPITGLSEFMDQMNVISKSMDIKPVETDETAKKEEYYEAENELMEVALGVYKEMRAYQALGITEDYIRTINARLLSLREEYAELHDKLVHNWYNSDNCQGKTFVSLANSVNTTPSCDTYDDENEASTGDLGSTYEAFELAADAFVEAKAAMQQKFEAAVQAGKIIEFSDSVYDIQYWVQWEKAFSADQVYEKFVQSANVFHMAYAAMKNAYDHLEEVEEDDDPIYDAKGNQTNKGATHWESQYGEEYKDGTSYEDYYAALATRYMNLCTGYDSWDVYRITEKMQEISETPGNLERIDQTIANERLKNIAGELTTYQEKLSAAQQHLTKIKKGVDSLTKLVQTYNDSFAQWTNATENLSAEQKQLSPLLENDAAEAEDVKKSREATDEAAQIITPENVKQMQNRVDGICDLINAYEKGIESCKYCGKEIMDIDSYKKFKKLPAIVENAIPMDKVALQAYADGLLVYEEQDSSLRPELMPDNNPDFNEPDENYLKVWSWMKLKFGELNEEDEDNARGIFEKLKEFGNEQIEESDKMDGDNNFKSLKDISEKEIKDKTDLPSKGSTDKSTSGSDKKKEAEENSNVVSGLFGNFNFSSIMEMADSIRDNLYCTMYVMNMFSYDTFNLEGRYNIATDGSKSVYKTKSEGLEEKNQNKELNLVSCKTIYQDTRITAEWTSEKASENSKNKTLTNKMLKNGEQYSFGNEVEYVLYGGFNASNKAKSYATIYAIRYAFDLVAVYGKYNKDKGVIAVSSAISSATCGVIPEPLVRMVIILGVNAAEAAVDLMYLKNGMPVRIFKDTDDLFLRFNLNYDETTKKYTTEKGEDRKAGSINVERSACWSYRDYMFLFTFLGLLFNGDAMYQRAADVIQSNMQVKQGEDYRLARSTIYFELTAQVKVDPLFLGSPISQSYGASVLDVSTWNQFTYIGVRGY